MDIKLFRPLSSLHNWSKNPRSIKKNDFERLKKQIETLGQYKPLLITEDGTVLGGNMRLRAYKELGIDEVWVSVVNAPTEDRKLEYALSDNDRAGYYDDDLLANLIPEYPDFIWSDFSVDMREPQNLGDIVDRFTPTVEDDAPPLSDEPAQSKLGEVYQLGRHRLMCGDATKIEDVEKLMGGQKADMVLTDPPYGMNLDIDFSQMGSKYGTSKNYGTSHDHRAKEEENTIIGDDKDYDPSHLFNMFPDVKEMFLWGGDYYAERILNKNKGSFFVWDKRVGIEDIQWATSEFEICWSKEKHQRQIIRCKWFGSQGTETQDINNRIHPTQKPIQVNTYFINKFSQPEQKIIDLFGGSGSTLIACEQTNRTCYMMELDPKYCDVIRKRYDNFKLLSSVKESAITLLPKGGGLETKQPSSSY